MRGTITKRGKSSWQLRFDTAPINGKRQRRHVTVRGTYKDAQRELTRLLAARDSATLPDPTRMTVGAYVMQWLGSAHEQSPKTLERYAELARNQILTFLGEHPLQKLRPEHVQAWHSTLLKTGLAPRTIGHAHKLLRLVLASAVANNTLTRNVAEIRKPLVEETEIEILAPEQIADVLTKLEGHTLSPIVSLALATGMRRGELLGLQWGDVDLDRGVARIERSLEETAGGLRLKPPKTRRGRRNIALPPEAVAMLRAHRIKLMEVRLIVGLGAIKPDTLVFGSVEGEPLSPRAVSRSWRRAVVARKLPAVTFHALRHTHASMLIRKGVDILTISRRLGHSKAAITLDVYGHLIEGADAAAAKAIEGVLK